MYAFRPSRRLRTVYVVSWLEPGRKTRRERFDTLSEAQDFARTKSLVIDISTHREVML